MLNVCKRGPASISRIFSAAVRTPSTKLSTLSLSFQNQAKPVLEARWIHVSPLRRQEATAQRYEHPHERAGAVQVEKFDQLIEHGLVHSNIVRAITEGMGHHTMTQVQSLTINQALQGTDIIAQAKTGTGKTIGFLLPLIQNILKKSPELASRQRYSKARTSDIRAIIISPTRELAEQIAVEASKLCSNTDLVVQVATGGNHKGMMLRKTQREGCHILVATPGRLNDLLTDQYSRISAPNLTTLVLDEADRLLDQGFSKDIEDIIDLLPDRREVDRQTLLFSATVPREVMGLVRSTLKPDFQFVQTVQEGDIATHEKVPQKIITVPGLENIMPSVLELAKRENEKASHASPGDSVKPFKAIIYFNSTANVILAHEVFQNLKSDGRGLFGKHPLYPAELLVMHGQLTQERRTRASERFRKAKTGILFSTDVTARGMDFPNVSHVIQIGPPPNREQYIHRIGRTGRGDQTGEGYIFVHTSELPVARRLLRGLPITPDVDLEAAKVDMTTEAQLPASLAATLVQIGDATKMVGRDIKNAAYLAYLTQSQAGNAAGIIAALNQWSRYGWGWDQPPQVGAGLARRMGLMRVPGVNIGSGGGSSSRGFGARDGGFGDRGAEGGRGGRSFGGSGGFGDDRGRGRFQNAGRGEGRSGDRGDRGFGGDRGRGGFQRGGRRDEEDFPF
ncbi:ATP-dependent RNA helicase [Hyphodiscus hymeniophilus]|uniref:ATP-dependent RNA helicase n=1 Tax=Hyphodiscus hymeniophilus TaxID=353542 RepID=A0A9P7AXE5_9HELO|nr:ATP-dependent RNA helicase [Hyphodiscus hymeniophilus]